MVLCENRLRFTALFFFLLLFGGRIQPRDKGDYCEEFELWPKLSQIRTPSHLTGDASLQSLLSHLHQPGKTDLSYLSEIMRFCCWREISGDSKKRWSTHVKAPSAEHLSSTKVQARANKYINRHNS
ncbi:hypothetical protein CFOL_v3_24722 [Cephalotus follicularis]|uniref:Uncharacterized protein n=1 Tax=Cephalotus follicularis TaxID=3775 RepID=A0A1Q3CLY6_CEPFO|nr:hypothetical protein CFOL_v3_24722 [Cephalotus follicularis]